MKVTEAVYFHFTVHGSLMFALLTRSSYLSLLGFRLLDFSSFRISTYIAQLQDLFNILEICTKNLAKMQLISASKKQIKTICET